MCGYHIYHVPDRHDQTCNPPFSSVKTAMFKRKARRSWHCATCFTVFIPIVSTASPDVVPPAIWGMHLEPKCRPTFWIRVSHGSRRCAVNMMGPEVHCVSFKGMGLDRMTCLVTCICLETFGPGWTWLVVSTQKQSIFLGWSETTN